MKSFILRICLPIVYGLVLACHSSTITEVLPSCSVAQPLQDLTWLKAIVTDTVATKNQNLYIYQTTYKSRTTYRVDMVRGPDLGLITLYDCRGSILAKGYTTIAGLQTDSKVIFDETKIGPLLYRR